MSQVVRLRVLPSRGDAVVLHRAGDGETLGGTPEDAKRSAYSSSARRRGRRGGTAGRTSQARRRVAAEAARAQAAVDDGDRHARALRRQEEVRPQLALGQHDEVAAAPAAARRTAQEKSSGQ